MQLQILFTADAAWMNLIDSRIGKTIPVLMAETPLTCVAEGCGILLDNIKRVEEDQKE